jgi:hypothetical protein
MSISKARNLWKTTMPRSAALKPEQVPADCKPTLDAITKNIGFTPNMMATFAQSPIALNAWATLLGSLSKAQPKVIGPSIFAVLFALIRKGIPKMTTSHTSGGR